MNWRSLTDGVIDAAKSSFGEEVLYSPSEGSPITITGIFNDIFEIIEEGTSNLMSSKPTLGVKSNDFEDFPIMGDRVTIRTKVYEVTEIQRDGESGLNLFLNEVL